jgi:hypothetical protein
VALDPSRQWLAAGITGLARRREWDAVVTADAPGAPGDEGQFVRLPDGRLLVESSSPEFDPEPLAQALESSLAAPYRAIAVRRPELWVVGASSIAVVALERDPRADTLEAVRDATGVSMRVDNLPTLEHVPELERIGEARSEWYVVRARRLEGLLYEVEVEPL